MSITTTSMPARCNSARRFVGLLTLLAALAGFAILTPRSEPVSAAPPPSGKAGPTLVGGQPLFAAWPKDAKPDAVIVFSGQTFGYLQPCGCSRPQIGGLERRAVFIEQLKAKGWPVVAVDLGDIHTEKAAVEKQGQLKYIATMNAMREMGYVAVGVGKTDLAADLFKLLASYALQKEQPPFTLAGNVVGKDGDKRIPREQFFPPLAKGQRPLVGAIEATEVGKIPVGIAGVVGKGLDEANEQQKWNPILAFPNAKQAIEDAKDALAKLPLKPQLKVLIFQGPIADAVKVATDFPQFQVILCQSESDLPPLQPRQVAHKDGTQTLIVTVGHKGQHVGVLGAFKKADGNFDFKYQLVPLTEEFITPGTDADALANNKVLPVLEDYAKKVKDLNLLKDYPKVKHPAQIQAAGFNPPVKLTFVGSDACKGCHAAEYAKWKQHQHSHAMATLEKYATRPSLRHFDGECVQCHTVGFHNQSGYVDDLTTKHLRDVGCENCHGPGSGHVAQPKRKDLLELLSSWKQPEATKLPDTAFMKKMADTPPQERGKIAIAPAQQLLIRRVEATCMKCHDHESDPHFDIYKSWPKVDHSGLAPKGGWPAVLPK